MYKSTLENGATFKGEWRIFHIVFLGLSLIGLLFLNACSTYHKKDGPPNYYVDASKVPDAVPKSEPLSRIGNKPVYYVFGKKYHVMPSSRNYNEVGVASWYGTMFHEHHTSNGERYNMLAMTAAHKSLPLPTYVEVTNLRNNRKVIVKVNDRGPFEANRIIDLSYVAAKKLGMLGHGTATVRVKAIDPVQYANRGFTNPLSFLFAHNSAPHHQIIKADNADIYLQVGAFKSRVYAERLQKKLRPMLSSPIYVSEAKQLYHVKVGPLKDVAAANQITRRLRVYGLM